MQRDYEGYAALDFEASSLSSSSWPIEVGISWIEAGRVRTWSSLIQPAPDWQVSDWSSQSEAVHNISRLRLRNAPTASEVAGEFLKKSSGLTLVSDAVPFERHWLSRLLDAGEKGPPPAIEDFDTVNFSLFEGLALDMLYERLRRTRIPHRAGPDSARLASGWLIASKLDEG